MKNQEIKVEGKSKKAQFLSIFLILLGSIFLGLFILEVFVRILPQKLTQIEYSIINDERIYTFSRHIKFKPYYTRVWTGLGVPTVWHFNNLGFRERPINKNKPSNIQRITVIGDSLVMGFGVEDFEAFPRRLEQVLKPKKTDPNMIHFEVVNMGIQGYSTPQYLAVLKEEALKIGSDLIIVVVYPSNDLSGGVGLMKDENYRRLLSIPDLISYPVNQYLKEKSRIYLFSLSKYYTMIKKYESNYKLSPKDDDLGWQIIENDLKEMKKAAEQKNSKLVVVSLPHPKEVVIEGKSENQSKIINLAKKLGIILYDPSEDLKLYNNPRELYIEDLDDHFSPIGNEYLASLLAKFLWDNKLVAKQPE